MKQISATCLGLLLLLSAGSGADERLPKPHRVHVEKCRIALIDHVTLAADRTGILANVEFKEGDTVTRGIRIALINDDVAKATLAVEEKKASTEVEVNFAKVARDAAEKEYTRMKDANKNGSKSVPELEVDKARLAADKAALSIEKAEHDLGVQKLDRDVKAAELKTFSVLAEFDGIVTRIFKKKGEAVRQGDPVAEIINTDKVRVEGQVKLADLRFVKRGAKAIVRLTVDGLDLPGENETFDGTITFVDLVSEPVEGSTRIYAEVINRDNILRAGLMAVMEIEAEDNPASDALRSKGADSVPKVPQAAVGRK